MKSADIKQLADVPELPPAAIAVEEQVAKTGEQYVGRFPTAYHPHGDYAAGMQERNPDAGRNAPTPNTAEVPAVDGPNKHLVVKADKINKGHGSSNVLVDGTDE